MRRIACPVVVTILHVVVLPLVQNLEECGALNIVSCYVSGQISLLIERAYSVSSRLSTAIGTDSRITSNTLKEVGIMHDICVLITRQCADTLGYRLTYSGFRLRADVCRIIHILYDSTAPSTSYYSSDIRCCIIFRFIHNLTIIITVVYDDLSILSVTGIVCCSTTNKTTDKHTRVL